MAGTVASSWLDGSSCDCGRSDGEKRGVLPPHPLTITSINQFKELESIIERDADTQHKEQNWSDVYSLESLKLTLDHIIQHCRIPRQQVLVEFPFSQYLTVLNTTNRNPPASPTRPQTNVDKKRLEVKRKELELLIKFYRNRIHWLSTASRLYCGLLSGSVVALLVEDSQCLIQLEAGHVSELYKSALTLLLNEQLVDKNMVYCIKFGSKVSPQRPQGLPFNKFKAECIKGFTQWIASLHGDTDDDTVSSTKTGETEEAEEGDGEQQDRAERRGCNLLEALKVALMIPDLDTICVLLSSMPDQPLDIISDYIEDRLSGEDTPTLHLVSFNASHDITTFLSTVASACGGHFHKYSSCPTQESEGRSLSAAGTMEDSDVQRIKEHIVRAERVLSELKNLDHGKMGEQLLEILRELSLSTDWEEDDDFPLQTPPTGEYCQVCSTAQWLREYGIEGQHLNLYRHLGPNAYPQLEDYVQITDNIVVSQVYNVMPLVPWEDGSVKYLHVDVHGLEHYLTTLRQYIVDILQRRLSWLQSGSRVPFGVLSESKVLVVVDSSHVVMGQVLTLQQHFRLLLEEQLAYIKEFNFIGSGQECRVWTSGFAEPNRPSLREAWEWVLGISPCGSCNLLSALRLIFESGTIFEEDTNLELAYEDVGIYLVISSMPDQTKEVLCSYLEQVTAGRDISVHIVYYNTQPLTDSSLYCNNEGGRCGTERELELSLKELAVAGKGRFHHYQVCAGTSVGCDLSALMEEITRATWYLEEGSRILQDYKEFCRRNVPVPSTPAPDNECIPTPSPPVHPRQNISSLARINAHNVDKNETVSSCKERRNVYHLKNQYFYTGRGLDKARSWNLVMTVTSKKSKPKPLIPTSEEYMSSKKWNSRYGIEALGLVLGNLIVTPTTTNCTGGSRHKSTPRYKHIDHKGEVTELCVDLKGLKSHATKLQTALKRYCDRLHWLETDAHKFFGVIFECEVLFLLDISTSMSAHLQTLTQGLSAQLTNLPPRTKKFNVMAFSGSVQQWQPDMMAVNKDTVFEAMQWVQELKTGGNSYLLQPLKDSLKSGASAIYLVTDGGVDHTHEFLLSQLPSLSSKYGSDYKIHTVGWYCSDKSELFLQQLAEMTGGRYHSYPDISKGEDHTLISREIAAAQRSLAQMNRYLL